ncbi:MAG: DUF1844 domain-containing protein [Candidatus Eremiobacteraeota bacterium]|nr:DUF1844 domain-containing protein [Candidatus Eremiobacteraeota bacterium]
MAPQPQATSAPPIETVLSDIFASLAFAAHAYLTASNDETKATDLEAAQTAIDLAGLTYERIAPRLPSEERLQMAALLTDLRMTCVRKRGL